MISHVSGLAPCQQSTGNTRSREYGRHAQGQLVYTHTERGTNGRREGVRGRCQDHERLAAEGIAITLALSALLWGLLAAAQRMP